MNTSENKEKIKQEIWHIEIKMLEYLLNICREYNLRCFADGGTLLGAVRHSGFIPWDDDVDIIMFREDYDKLLKIGKTVFQNPIFFQSYETDSDYFHPHIQLRYMGTTAILLSEKNHVRFHQGIFIDIFPLDGVPQDKIRRFFQWGKILVYRKLSTIIGMHDQKNLRIKKILKPIISHKTIFQLQNSLNNECRKYQNSNLATLLSINRTSSTNLLQRSWYDETVFLPFENIQIPAPREYDKVLRVKYGADYMIPQKKRCMHGEILFDSHKSYEQYSEQN